MCVFDVDRAKSRVNITVNNYFKIIIFYTRINVISGNAERCVSLMVDRAKTRVAFGKPLIEQGSIQQDIALSR